MTPHAITTMSLLLCGLVLLVVGALLNSEPLLTVGTSVMGTGIAYALGKGIANRIEPKDTP